MVADVEAVTARVAIVKFAAVAPAAMVTLAGTVAAVLLLLSVTTAPPAGAALVNRAVPATEVPPTTAVELNVIEESDAAVVVDCGVKRRVLDHAPAVPAELIARTRQECRRPATSVEAVNCDVVTV